MRFSFFFPLFFLIALLFCRDTTSRIQRRVCLSLHYLSHGSSMYRDRALARACIEFPSTGSAINLANNKPLERDEWDRVTITGARVDTFRTRDRRARSPSPHPDRRRDKARRTVSAAIAPSNSLARVSLHVYVYTRDYGSPRRRPPAPVNKRGRPLRRANYRAREEILRDIALFQRCAAPRSKRYSIVAFIAATRRNHGAKISSFASRQHIYIQGVPF